MILLYHNVPQIASVYSNIIFFFYIGRFLLLLRCNFCIVMAVILTVIMSGRISAYSSERFLSSTAHQILRVEGRHLTNLVRYGILTAEGKNSTRGKPFSHLTVRVLHISAWFDSLRIRLDHIFDHLPIRTTWKQCDGEHRKASFSD